MNDSGEMGVGVGKKFAMQRRNEAISVVKSPFHLFRILD